MKDLPRIFANPINKNISNNRSYSYSKLVNDNIRDERLVLEKLNKLFKEDQMVYSIDCIIKFKDTQSKYTIIGRTNNNLLTRSQKLIPIKDIYDIDLA